MFLLKNTFAICFFQSASLPVCLENWNFEKPRFKFCSFVFFFYQRTEFELVFVHHLIYLFYMLHKCMDSFCINILFITRLRYIFLRMLGLYYRAADIISVVNCSINMWTAYVSAAGNNFNIMFITIERTIP